MRHSPMAPAVHVAEASTTCGVNRDIDDIAYVGEGDLDEGAVEGVEPGRSGPAAMNAAETMASRAQGLNGDLGVGGEDGGG
ncbi:MAG: hypothetical protein ACE366_30080 [Bradymonadia bacterium]